ncbi:MAG: phosphodiester glycosidase family protein [Armatimonadota bacterium]
MTGSNLILISALLGSMSYQPQQPSSIAYQQVHFHNIVAHVITVDLHDPEIKVSVALAAGGTGKTESFKSLVARVKPCVAITGTFFDTKSLLPTGDIALFGSLIHSGVIGSALTIDSNNNARIVPLRTGRQTNWQGCETVLCAGPTLVANGEVAIALEHEGFRTSLKSPSRRTAVAITKQGKLLLVCINRRASLYDLAKLLVKLNAQDAALLDGGSSTALYYRGRYLAVPRRTLTNCLVVYSSQEAYNTAKSKLVPAGVLARVMMDMQ